MQMFLASPAELTSLVKPVGKKPPEQHKVRSCVVESTGRSITFTYQTLCESSYSPSGESRYDNKPEKGIGLVVVSNPMVGWR